jgi:hypothetical protein
MLPPFLKRRMSARDTTLVGVGVLLLCGLGYLGYQEITARLFQRRLMALAPKFSAGIRTQRAGLVKAIEAYKTQFGAYPPDHVLQQQPLVVDPVTNSLLYELAGVIYTSTNNQFQVAGLESADANFVKQFLQCKSFKNCGETEAQVKHFLSHDELPTWQFHDDPDVFGLGVPLDTTEADAEALWAFYAGISPWRYVSTSPTNNPGRFDLWVEFKVAGKTTIIGNWQGAD